MGSSGSKQSWSRSCQYSKGPPIPSTEYNVTKNKGQGKAKKPEKGDHQKGTGSWTVTECSPRTIASPPVPPPLSLPPPKLLEERASAASRGCAWRRAGVKWGETMSFVAEAAAGGRGKGYRRVGEAIGGGAREKVLSQQPSRATEDPDRELRDPNHNNDNEKKATAISQRRKRLSRSKIIPQTRLEEARNNGGHTGLVANNPGDPLGPSAVAEVLPLHRRAAAPFSPLRPREPLTQCTAAGTAANESGRPPRISTGSAATPLDARFARRLPSPVQTNTPARK